MRCQALVLAALLAACLLSCSGTGPKARPYDPVVKDTSDPARRAAVPDALPGRRSLQPPQTKILVGNIPVRVRLARTSEQHHRGLAGVKRLDPDQGMLFVYAAPAQRNFWMQGCFIPLDIAYVGADQRVLQVTTLQPPGKAATSGRIPSVLSKQPVALVLEMAGGWFASHGLGVGTALRVDPALLHE